MEEENKTAGGLGFFRFVTFGVSILSSASTPSPGLAHAAQGNYRHCACRRVSWRGRTPTGALTPEGAGKCWVQSYGRSPSPCLTPLPWNMPMSFQLAGRPGVYDLSDYYPSASKPSVAKAGSRGAAPGLSNRGRA